MSLLVCLLKKRIYSFFLCFRSYILKNPILMMKYTEISIFDCLLLVRENL